MPGSRCTVALGLGGSLRQSEEAADAPHELEFPSAMRNEDVLLPKAFGLRLSLVVPFQTCKELRRLFAP